MNKIELTTSIRAPIERCFDLARSVDLHKISMSHSDETIVSGIQSGLMTLNDTVTWKGKHFGIRFRLQSTITKFTRPFFFTDEMTRGPFKKMVHHHFFYNTEGATTMVDHFYFQSPLGMLGKLVDSMILKTYLNRLLSHRNEVIRQYAENEKWTSLLPSPERLYKPL